LHLRPQVLQADLGQASLGLLACAADGGEIIIGLLAHARQFGVGRSHLPLELGVTLLQATLEFSVRGLKGLLQLLVGRRLVSLAFGCGRAHGAQKVALRL
jgi:hypothetical protein